MQLDILAHRNIGNTAGILFCQTGNRTQLRRVDKSIRQANAQHEVRRRPALASYAADSAATIALRVNTPPAEVCFYPGVGNGRESLPRELADFLKTFPGVLLKLEALSPLGFRFLDRYSQFRAHVVHL